MPVDTVVTGTIAGGSPCVSGIKSMVKCYWVPFTIGFRICTKFSTVPVRGLDHMSGYFLNDQHKALESIFSLVQKVPAR